MKVLFPTDSTFTLSVDEAATAEPEKQLAQFPFQNFVVELQFLVAGQCDMPTRCALSWTCQQYYAQFGDKDFDCFAFADKCAELGYRTLLKHSFDRGGPLDWRTSNVAAFNGHVDIMQMYVRQALKHDLKVDPKQISIEVQNWAIEAASAGQHQVLEWLKFDQWQDVHAMRVVAAVATQNDHMDIALDAFERAKALRIEPASITPFFRELLNAACRGGSLEVVQRILQLAPNEFVVDWVSLLRWVGTNGKRASIIAWLFERTPELATAQFLDKIVEMGLSHGDVKLLELAEKHGAIIAIDHFLPANSSELLPHVNALKYLHAKFKWPAAPFQAQSCPLLRAEDDDMQWKENQGYQFDFSTVDFEDLRMPIDEKELKLLPWIFQRVRFTPSYICRLAIFCRVDLLDLFYEVKADAVRPDDLAIAKLLDHWRDNLERDKRFRMRPILNTIRWLRSKGYTFDTASCEGFVSAFLKKKPRLCKAYWEEIKALNMPIKDLTRRLVGHIVAYKL